MSSERLRPKQEQNLGAGARERATHETTEAARTENRVSHAHDATFAND